MAGRPRAVSDEEVMAAVARVLSRNGPIAMTLADVGTEVGVSAPALLQRFGSKRNLLLAFSQGEPGAVARIFDGARAGGLGPLDTLVRALLELASGMDGPDEVANNLAMLQLELTDPEFRVHVVAHARETKKAIVKLLKEATVRGELTDVDHTRLGEAVYIAYSGALLTWAIDGKGSLASFLKKHVTTVLMPHRTTQPAGGRGRNRG